MPSPFSKEIGDEWDRLISRPDRTLEDGRQPHPEEIAGSKALYAKAIEDGKWQVSVADASLVASLGVSIAFQEYRYADAVDLARQFLNHPGLEHSDPVYSKEHFLSALGLNLMLIGRIEEGLAEFERMLTKLPGPLSHRRRLVRNQLIILAEEGDAEAAPDLKVVAFASQLLSNMPGQKRKSAKILDAKSNQEFIDILESTFAPRKSI